MTRRPALSGVPGCLHALRSNEPAHADPGKAAAARQAGPDKGLEQPRRAVAVGAVLTAMAAVVIDAGVSSVALPTIADSLGIAPAKAVLVVTAYQVALVMALLPCAALGERFGYRRVFAWGVALFVAASLASALARSLPWLVAARFFQGLGGAAILALGVALLRLSVSDGRLGAAIGWNAVTVALAAAAGPAIGAVILSSADWPWLYAVNLPLGLAAMLATRALPTTAAQAGRLDVLSMALNCSVFGFLVAAGEIARTAPAVAAILLVAAAFALIVLVRRETPKVKPLIPFDLLRSRPFSISVMASVCCFAGQTAGLLALPFYLQHELGQSPMMTALYMTAWPLGVAAIAAVAGRAVNRVSTAWLCVAGGAVLASSLAAAAIWPLHDKPDALAIILVVGGMAFGIFQVSNNRNMFLSAPREQSGAAGAVQGTARVTGQTAGTLFLALLFALVPMAEAPQLALGFGAVFTLAAGIISTLRTG